MDFNEALKGEKDRFFELPERKDGELKQYCRYCAHCFEGDGYYCGEKVMVLTEAEIKRENKCKDFWYCVNGDVITGKHYKPQIHRKRNDQVKFDI